MSKKMPQIREYMTPTPHTIGADIPLKKAQEHMREFRMRHLPVRRDGHLVGIVSDRIINEALATPEGARLAVEDVMIPNPFHVEPQTPLDLVVAEMAEEKYGCALIQDASGKLLGIFTTVDACRALRQILETVYPE